MSCLEEDYNTVAETSAIKELLLNFGLELKKLRDVSGMKESAGSRCRNVFQLLLTFSLWLLRLSFVEEMSVPSSRSVSAVGKSRLAASPSPGAGVEACLWAVLQSTATALSRSEGWNGMKQGQQSVE